MRLKFNRKTHKNIAGLKKPATFFPKREELSFNNRVSAIIRQTSQHIIAAWAIMEEQSTNLCDNAQIRRDIALTSRDYA